MTWIRNSRMSIYLTPATFLNTLWGANPQVTLLISSCREDEWTCDDGSCVLRYQRCDRIQHCHDNTDEENCHVIVPIKSYNKLLNPPGQDGRILQLSLSINITNIRKLQLTTFSVTIDVTQGVTWRESRVKYRHLTNSWTQVRVPDDLWLPQFYFEDESKNPLIFHKNGQSMFIGKYGPPQRTSSEDLDDGKYRRTILLSK